MNAAPAAGTCLPCAGSKRSYQARAPARTANIDRDRADPQRERETLLRLAKAGEDRDETTEYQVLRMAKYARLIAEQICLPCVECGEIELSATMHDIGKMGIPDHILLKPDKLTAESEIMRTATTSYLLYPTGRGNRVRPWLAQEL
jgi:response regulator RpfG family c-di-GMP phosphodiesterase